jgi:hypothetical protein
MTERANPFGDLTGFEPAKPKTTSSDPTAKAVIDQVAAEHNFPSRQATKPAAQPAPRQQRRYRTGRNQQINVKATAETVAQFNRLADELGVPLGEVLERALKALEDTK